MERAEYNRHSRARMGGNSKRRVETCNAGRAGAHRPSEALHPTRSSDVLPRIARERVPTVPHVAKTRRDVPRRIARERVPTKKTESRRQSSPQQLSDLVPAGKGHLPETMQTTRVTLVCRRA